MNYDEIRKQKNESQARFYEHLFASRDNGSYQVDKRCLNSVLINPKYLPKLNIKNLPKFS